MMILLFFYGLHCYIVGVNFPPFESEHARFRIIFRLGNCLSVTCCQFPLWWYCVPFYVLCLGKLLWCRQYR